MQLLDSDMAIMFCKKCSDTCYPHDGTKTHSSNKGSFQAVIFSLLHQTIEAVEHCSVGAPILLKCDEMPANNCLDRA